MLKKGYSRGRRGFTLIELLVSLTIIAIIVAISVFAAGGARQQGRDTQRRSDLEKIRQALEIIKADCGAYPTTVSGYAEANTILDQAGNDDILNGNDVMAYGLPSCPTLGSTDVYLSRIPIDPSSTNRRYRFRGFGNSYQLCAALEGGSGSVACGGNCGSVACNYLVVNP